jgi:hypothetical protein
MKQQPFIASYPKDYEWLTPCLQTFRRHGPPFFEPPVVCVATEDYDSATALCADAYPEVQVVIFDAEPGSLRAQASMMNADNLCPPDTDYVWFVGSDCCLTDKPELDHYFSQREDETWWPDLFTNSYEHLLEHGADVKRWQIGTSKHVGYDVRHEFMRRLPLPYSRKVLDGTRRHLEKIHNTTWLKYMISVWDDGDFSESNVIGAWAYRYCVEAYNWVDRDAEFRHLYPERPNHLRQFWSHGGLDRPADGFGDVPREVYEKVLTL